MATLREMGLTVALVAATGGAAMATWSYFSARRRKAAARDHKLEHGGEKSADSDTPIPHEGEPGTAPGAAGCGDFAIAGKGSPALKVGEDRVGRREEAAVPAAGTTPRHEEAAVPAAGTPPRHEEAAVPAPGTPPCHEEAAVPAAGTTPRHEEDKADRTEEAAVPAVGTPPRHEEGMGGLPCPAAVESPVMRDSHISAHTLPQVKTSPCKHVVVLGLDGSGKTSVLNCIASNKGHIVTTPTGGVNAMCLSDGNSKMEFLEIGGSEQLRPYWKMYLSKAFAIIFVVDAADHSRLPLAKRHLHQLIQQDAVLPLIVLANKQDLENAYHITEIHDALALSDICENRKLFLIGTHVTNCDSDISSGIQDTKEYLVQLFSEHPV